MKDSTIKAAFITAILGPVIVVLFTWFLNNDLKGRQIEHGNKLDSLLIVERVHVHLDSLILRSDTIYDSTK